MLLSAMCVAWWAFWDLFWPEEENPSLHKHVVWKFVISKDQEERLGRRPQGHFCWPWKAHACILHLGIFQALNILHINTHISYPPTHRRPSSVRGKWQTSCCKQVDVELRESFQLNTHQTNPGLGRADESFCPTEKVRQHEQSRFCPRIQNEWKREEASKKKRWRYPQVFVRFDCNHRSRSDCSYFRRRSKIGGSHCWLLVKPVLSRK